MAFQIGDLFKLSSVPIWMVLYFLLFLWFMLSRNFNFTSFALRVWDYGCFFYDRVLEKCSSSNLFQIHANFIRPPIIDTTAERIQYIAVFPPARVFPQDMEEYYVRDFGVSANLDEQTEIIQDPFAVIKNRSRNFQIETNFPRRPDDKTAKKIKYEFNFEHNICAKPLVIPGTQVLPEGTELYSVRDIGVSTDPEEKIKIIKKHHNSDTSIVRREKFCLEFEDPPIITDSEWQLISNIKFSSVKRMEMKPDERVENETLDKEYQTFRERCFRNLNLEGLIVLDPKARR